MAHFAQIDADNIVRQVIVVRNCAIGGCIGPDHPDYQANPEQHADCGDLDFPDTEPLGQEMLQASGFAGDFRQCSYSGSFRGAYPGQGWSYDPDLDEFIPPSTPEPTA
jgi:hypothetical protein